MARKEYDREYKLNAINLVLDQGLGSKEVSQDLGVGHSTLNKWIRDYQEDPQGAFPGKGHLRPQDVEVHKLRREVTLLKMERDILKKGIPILAEIRRRNSSVSKS